MLPIEDTDVSLERFPVELFQFSATLLSSSERVGSPPLLP